jgi:hypothetical protein
MRANGSAPSPLGGTELLDEYFIENRTRLLEVAAFLDRLDRGAGTTAEDFRMLAFARALGVLAGPGPDRVERIQLVFSDPTLEPLPALDRKSACGAHPAWPLEAR